MYDTITFLTDFGLQDDFVGVCRGVMKRIARDAQILDVTHGIAPQAVRQGALVLARAIPYLPLGIHLAVVDPGVGSERRALAVRTAAGRVYVGPDNGLLMLAADRDGIEGARSLTNPRYHLERVSKTFHARDLFAPVAAHLAAGAHFDDLGEDVDLATLVRLDLPVVRIEGGELVRDDPRRRPLRQPRAERLRGRRRRARRCADGDRVELAFALTPYYAVVGETYADAAPRRADRLRGLLRRLVDRDQRRQRRRADGGRGRTTRCASAPV